MKPLSFDVHGSIAALAARNSRMLDMFDPAEAAVELCKVSPEVPYHELPKAVERIWKQLLAEFGMDGFGAFQKLTMLYLLGDFERRAEKRNYSPSIMSRFDSSISRILSVINSERSRKYHTRSDSLLKDLAICSQKVFPAGGARVVEPAGAFPRSLMFKRVGLQTMRVISLLFRCGGNKPFYQTHTHLGELSEFNKESYALCNVRLADMLILNPEVKGVHCGSWLYDPALSSVSPWLSYMCDIPLENGAVLLYHGVSKTGDALKHSKERRALYEIGKYVPRSYHVIWPRRELIAWAEKARRERRPQH